MSNTSLLGSYGAQGDSSLMFRNRIINGDMRIDQRGVSLANANGIVVDRFSAGYYGGATGRFLAERSVTVPAGFTNSFLLTTTTAQAVLGANDAFAIRQAIEGFNVADLSFGQSNAQTVTVSFWVRSSQTGTFSVLLLNSAGDRCYGALVTVNAVDTFEYKTVTILGDTSGTWLKENGIGIQLFFGLGAGSSRTVAAGWSSGTAGQVTPGAVTGQTINICASAGANIRITGVQLEAGPTATPFERRPYSVELGMCQRYYWRESAGLSSSYKAVVMPLTTTRVLGAPFCLPVPLRNSSDAGLTVAYSGVVLYNYALSSVVNVINITAYSSAANATHITLDMTCNALGGTSQPYLLALNGGTGFIAISAEL